MLSSINVKGFRKYENLTLDNLGRINFILGKNNIGKTSILEAIYAFLDGILTLAHNKTYSKYSF